VVGTSAEPWARAQTLSGGRRTNDDLTRTSAQAHHGMKVRRFRVQDYLSWIFPQDIYRKNTEEHKPRWLKTFISSADGSGTYR